MKKWILNSEKSIPRQRGRKNDSHPLWNERLFRPFLGGGQVNTINAQGSVAVQ